MAADPRGLAGVDLNLLVSLDALLGEASVTAAGAKVGLSQPAMSRSLGRLRDLLQDPLLVRDGARMRLTPRAEALAPRVRALLDEVQATLSDGEGFDPAQDRRTFRVATNDYGGAVIVPRLAARIAERAPRVDLDVRALGAATPTRDLAEGQLDLAIGTFLEPAAPLHEEVLFDEGFVCVMRRAHPLAGRPLTLEAYASARHVLITAPRDGPGVVDHALAAKGRSRRIAVRVPHFLVAPRVAAGGDLVLTLAARLASLAEAALDLEVRPPPLELPRFEVKMLWHPRVEGDPGVRWLAAQIRDLVGPDGLVARC